MVVENEKESDDNWSPEIGGLHAIRERINIFVHYVKSRPTLEPFELYDNFCMMFLFILQLQYLNK